MLVSSMADFPTKLFKSSGSVFLPRTFSQVEEGV